MDSISDHSECASQECHWPKYHTDRENILKGKFENCQFCQMKVNQQIKF